MVTFRTRAYFHHTVSSLSQTAVYGTFCHKIHGSSYSRCLDDGFNISHPRSKESPKYHRQHVYTWSNSLVTCPASWFQVSNRCVDILNIARLRENADDFVAANCIYRSAPRLTKDYDGTVCEDTFVHMYLDGLLDGIFSTEPLLKQEWANRWMATSRENANYIYKPDWIVYIKPWNQSFGVVACEAKAPRKKNGGPVSGFLKLGVEMMRMLSALKNSIDAPFVLGIFVEGTIVRTYYMDTLGDNAWRMIELGQAELVTRLTAFGLFPALYQLIVQVKNLAVEMGNRIEESQLNRAMTKCSAEKVFSSSTVSRRKSKKSSQYIADKFCR